MLNSSYSSTASAVSEFWILSDIYDGEEYEKHSEFFESQCNVSFALNFDGAPKFKSS